MRPRFLTGDLILHTGWDRLSWCRTIAMVVSVMPANDVPDAQIRGIEAQPWIYYVLDVNTNIINGPLTSSEMDSA